MARFYFPVEYDGFACADDHGEDFAESELRGDVQNFKPEEAAVLALLRARLEGSRTDGGKKTAREGRVDV